MATDTPMQLGMVGLGRMGAGIVRRLMRDGHSCVGYDVNPEAVQALAADGAVRSDSLAGFRRQAVQAPHGVGHGPCGRYHGQDDRRPSPTCSRKAMSSSTGATPTTATTSAMPAALRPQGIHHVDCGTSGGVWGFERGFCLMIGGEADVVERLCPLFAVDRPGRR